MPDSFQTARMATDMIEVDPTAVAAAGRRVAGLAADVRRLQESYAACAPLAPALGAAELAQPWAWAHGAWAGQVARLRGRLEGLGEAAERGGGVYAEAERDAVAAHPR